MLNIEKNYDFLKRFRQIHKPDRRTVFRAAGADEIMLDESWSIYCGSESSNEIKRAADDLQDYLFVSLGLSLRLTPKIQDKCIVFVNSNTKVKPGAYEIEVAADKIVVNGDDLKGVLRGGIALEDAMNLVEGPYLKIQKQRYEPLLKMRIIHSGCAIDDFPDWQLNAILHAGYTAIDVFVRDIDENAKHEYCNITELIERAESYGLDTILYNYMRCFIHPEDENADKVIDGIYGRLFRTYPKAAGISLVGESLEFPSKDERTTGKRFRESVVDGIPDNRPSPGWFPCYDYPLLLTKIVNSIHRVKPDANIVFSTYNWSYLGEKEREEFLAKCPKGLTVNIAYEMQKKKIIDGVKFSVMDYTASAAEPGEYFVSEAEAVRKNGLDIRVCSNTGGNSWDMGAAPYIPVPQLWLKRMRTLQKYAREYKAYYFYEGHHFGWWPNICNDLMKKLYYSPESVVDDEAFLKMLAVRDYGDAEVVKVWDLWSEALTHITTSNEDQYGPLRTGPSYPFVFQVNITRTLGAKEIPFPCSPKAMMGNGIIKTLYQSYEAAGQSPGVMRYPIDLKELATLLELWGRGLEMLEKVISRIKDSRKLENAERLFALGKYIFNSVRTVINIKKWYLTTLELKSCADPVKASALLDKLIEIAAVERENVIDTIPYVECDSRLGWEPSMEYVCDKWHLEWKLRQLDFALKEIEDYRKILFE